jgi:outer membrane lipoprotein carrier protein
MAFLLFFAHASSWIRISNGRFFFVKKIIERFAPPYRIFITAFIFTKCHGSDMLTEIRAIGELLIRIFITGYTMVNKKRIFLLSTVMILNLFVCSIPPDETGLSSLAAAENLSLEQILNGMEGRYANSAFSAKFLQESTIKAMEITDFASGKVYVRHPGMMRWEYDEPDKQIIITDGLKLWIYRPDDNQVMTGAAPVFFRDGKGASFLSDIKLIRQKFKISLLNSEGDLFYEFKLIPIEKTMDVADIRLSVSKITFTIIRVITQNFYGDETRIEFMNSEFNLDLDDALFSFEIPEGVDVLKLDE